ncbi:MAG: WecB/TagA/CpsF family glycosyltransferase [Gammaproteobacteria bacterium]|nr:WecB/TagA/CpsF family glycosyltransferase [Gammaproteobacteria bacterium]MBU1969735.1 WecB/TagA/CpsF family glycosyltransferase [Gammaproteobacteria bacterium]
MIENRQIIGLDVVALSRKDALALLEKRISDKVPTRLAFVNANLANTAYEDEGIQNMLRSFLLLNDGAGVNLASKLLYRQPFPDNLNGTDFTPCFLDHCGVPLRIFLLGASPSVVARTAEFFTRRWPQHNVVGYQHGFFPKSEEGQLIERIRAANPSLVLVAMGNGLQERWVEKLVPESALSAWGVGALFDFLCGEVHRAPLWMRWLGIEWFFRLLQEPGRMWRRYLIGNPKFVFRVLCELGSKTFK